MLWSFILNIPLTFTLLLTYLFSIGDVGSAIDDPTGFPFIFVLRNATGTKGGAIALVSLVLALLMVIAISTLASTSRQTWAFSRDGGLPGSQLLSRVSFMSASSVELTKMTIMQVHPSMKIPRNSILFTCAYTIVLSLINIGSTVAFNAVISLAASALMATYTLSVGCVTLKRFRKQQLPAARWSLGRYGLLVNCLALTYSCWSFFWSFWPNSYKPTAATFNWDCVLFVGVMGCAATLYFVHARKVYEGPVVSVRW